MPECLIIDRQTDRQTDAINLSFRCVFLYVTLFNIRPPEAGISRKAVKPFHGFPSPAVFCVQATSSAVSGMCVSDRTHWRKRGSGSRLRG